MDWFLYDNGLRHERVTIKFILSYYYIRSFSQIFLKLASLLCGIYLSFEKYFSRRAVIVRQVKRITVEELFLGLTVV